MTGDIDLVATDHSPAPPRLKALDDGDFVDAWGGIASLQLGLAAVWTGMLERGVPLERTAPMARQGTGASCRARRLQRCDSRR